MSIPSLSFGFGDSKSASMQPTEFPQHESGPTRLNFNNHISSLHSASASASPQSSQSQHEPHSHPHTTHSFQHPQQTRLKRRFSHDEDVNTSTNGTKIRGSNNHRIQKLKPSSKRTFLQSKKHKSQDVNGEPLPLKRMIDTLDHESLQELMKNLIDRRSDITQDVIDLAPKITVDQVLKVLNAKIDQINQSLPYKVDPSSDYSYLRVQKIVVEFFNSFSDYILNFLAPVEEDVTVTLKFLNEFLMNIFHKIPSFQNLEFKFFYDLSVEKLNWIFVCYLRKFLRLNKSNILVIIKDNWLDIVGQINELNHLKFQQVYDFVKQEIELFEERGSYYNSTSNDTDSIEDEIDDTEGATKLRGLNNLINFSENNSPLIGNVVGDSTYLL